MKKLLLLLSAIVLSVAYSNAQTTAPNGGFETWQTKILIFNPLTPLDVPTSWSTFDSLANSLNFLLGQTTAIQKTVTKSTAVKNSGTMSAVLTTKTFSSLGAVPGILTNATVNLDASFNLTFSGGAPITQRVSMASAYLKYAPATADSGSFAVEIINRTLGVDSVIGSGGVQFGAKANFTKVDVPVTYITTNLPANLIRFYFTNSNDTVQNSSTLYVDDVTYTNTTGITEALMNDIEITAYPNPASDALTIKASSEDALLFELYAMDGKVMLTKTFSKATQINVAELASGLYLYTVKNKDQAIIKKASFTIAH